MNGGGGGGGRLEVGGCGGYGEKWGLWGGGGDGEGGREEVGYREGGGGVLHYGRALKPARILIEVP